jgi:hypothetical protein
VNVSRNNSLYNVHSLKYTVYIMLDETETYNPEGVRILEKRDYVLFNLLKPSGNFTYHQV